LLPHDQPAPQRSVRTRAAGVDNGDNCQCFVYVEDALRFRPTRSGSSAGAATSGAAGSSRSIVPSISVALSDGATAEGATMELLPVVDAAAAVAVPSLDSLAAAMRANPCARAASKAGLDSCSALHLQRISNTSKHIHGAPDRALVVGESDRPACRMLRPAGFLDCPEYSGQGAPCYRDPKLSPPGGTGG
jgi:hypothetical protein